MSTQLLAQMKQHLNQLELQAAKQGIYTPADVRTEIQRYSTGVHLLTRLIIHRNSLVNTLLPQAATFGINTPPYIRTEIINNRNQIAALKRALRQVEFTITDNDEDSEAVINTASSSAAAVDVNPILEYIGTELNRLEVAVRKNDRSTALQIIKELKDFMAD